MRGKSNEWVQSYLTDRNQFVTLDQCSSDKLQISCGVPQGSVLGPKLFILYINDICNVSNVLKLILFADDTSALASGKNIHDLCHKITEELSKLKKWFILNKLSLNVAKTNYILFRQSKSQRTGHIKIGTNDIKQVDHTKFLGVDVDEKLNWKIHIEKVAKKLSKCCATLFYASQKLHTDALVILYNSVFKPQFEYCCETWGNTYHTNVVPIITAQKRAIRTLLMEKRHTHTSPLFKKLRQLKFTDMIKFKTLVLMHTALSVKLPDSLQELFRKTTIKSHNTRSKSDFVQPMARSTRRCHSVSVVGPKLWNSLPTNITNLRNIAQFKKALKQYLLAYY